MHKSLLSPILFNLYFTELDSFIEKLKNEILVSKEYKWQNEISKKYRRFWKKFSDKKKLVLELKKYGSPELVLAAYQDEKKEFYRKHRYIEDINLLYVRYTNDFLLGIVGPKLLAVDISNKIKNFVWKNLHVSCINISMVNRNEKGVRFLGFIINLLQFRKKVVFKNSKIQSVKRYIARSKALAAASLAKNSKAFFYALRWDIILSLEKLCFKFNNSNFKYTKKRRKEMSSYFRILFSKNISLALKYFTENFELFINDAIFKTTKKTMELYLLIKHFLNNVKKFETWIKENWLFKRRSVALEQYQKKDKNKSIVSVKISQEDSIRTVEVLASQLISLWQTRYISIKFPLKDFYNEMRKLGYVHLKKNRSISQISLLNLSDYEIIIFFNSLIRGYLNWYWCADNISDVKKIYHILKNSCLLTLARKHKKDYSWSLNVFTNSPYVKHNGRKFSLPDKHFISHFEKKFLVGSQIDFIREKSSYKSFCSWWYIKSNLYNNILY